jgi:toxin ParE1/3/4
VIDRERGEAQTDKYLAEIGAGITQLQEHPELGKSRDDLRAGYRSPRINQHVVYDMVMPSVIRVLHRRMDPDSNLQRFPHVVRSSRQPLGACHV